MKNFKRCSTAALFMFAAVTAFASVPQTSIAQTAQAPENAPSWSVNCNNNADPARLDCNMSQTIFQKGTGQRIIASSIFKNGDTHAMVLSLPHGIDLPSGVDVFVDQGAAQKFPIQTADANGAYSRFDLTPDMIAAMRSGNTLIVRIMGAAKNEVRMEMSLAGFSSSFGLISQ